MPIKLQFISPADDGKRHFELINGEEVGGYMESLYISPFEEEEESSSASTGPSHHPGPETTVPPVGSDELSLSSLIIEGIGRIAYPGSSVRQRRSTTVALEEDRRAALT
ncbi:hypothetical protein EYF80_004894 [Liparis tanakae]|uniref:Uncharacterized protein n=1 Tax=Liparis tanakae TaxID=230148 RepID=A0A4Z2J3Q3_9TELE|nr:hypothetical protein EYF80_004894 [Liparis tanakae]